MSSSKRALEAVTLSSDSDSAQKPLKRQLKQSPQPQPHPSSLNALPSRAQLEAERLARAKAREGDVTAGPSSYKVKPAPNPVRVSTMSSVKESNDEPAASTSSGTSRSKIGGMASILSGAGSSSSSSSNHDQRFWSGALKRVPNMYK